MAAYYNEIDPFAAAWLRELIREKLIADGEVDTRSIELVQPADVRGFVQCHFFAGIGGWSYALRLAGWPDDRPVWTGSCPCQPWSVAGSGEGANDPRHLWPAWSKLIEQCHPAVVFGEQVASEDGRYWLDLVFHDMEARGYAVGAFDLPACSIGAPHKRSRLWFVADSHGERVSDGGLRQVDGAPPDSAKETWQQRVWADPEPSGETLCDCGHRSDVHDFGIDDCDECSCIRFTRPLDNTERSRAERESVREGRTESSASGGRQDERRGGIQAFNSSDARFMGHADSSGLALGPFDKDGQRAVRIEGPAFGETGATRGFWADCDWLWHRDGCYRAVEPGAFPLAARVPGDMEQIRCYGNAIVPQVAQAFIEAYLETRE